MKKRITLAALIISSVFLFTTMDMQAAPKTMADGTVFDAEFYAATYPDVKEAVGSDENALYDHYVNYGKAEGRKPVADTTVKTAVGKKTDTSKKSDAGKKTGTASGTVEKASASAAAKSTGADGMCWKSATGSKYHSIDHCGKMNPKKAKKITIEEAKKEGLEACSKCW